jgi:hypothetical protein
MNAPIKCITEYEPANAEAYKRANKKSDLIVRLNAFRNDIGHALFPHRQETRRISWQPVFFT